MGWTDVYVDPAYADLGDIARASPEVLVSALIEERYGRRCAEIRQEVEAVALPADRAADLRAAADTPALRILRHYVDAAGKTVEISVSIHPAGRFTATQRLRRVVEG